MGELRCQIKEVDPTQWDGFRYLAHVALELEAPADSYPAERDAVTDWCQEQFGESHFSNARWYYSFAYGWMIRDPKDAIAFRMRWC